MVTGTILAMAGPAVPAGYLACNGQLVAKATHPDLYAAIGSLWGPDVGAFFTLPDLRGRCLLGYGTGSGLTPRSLAATGGDETHQLNSDESGLPSHAHAITDSGHSHAITDPGHAHDVTDLGHAHDVTDPQHNHVQEGYIEDNPGSGTIAYGTDYNEGDSNEIRTENASTGVSVDTAVTGLTVDANTTDISVDSAGTGLTVDAATPANADQPHNNMQPWAAVNYVIKT